MSAVNFRGYIAMPLETMAQEIYTKSKQSFFHADIIETGGFAALMAYLLQVKCGNDNAVKNFLQTLQPYFCLSAHEIPLNEAQQLFGRFQELISDDSDEHN